MIALLVLGGAAFGAWQLVGRAAAPQVQVAMVREVARGLPRQAVPRRVAA